jgi:hypothetical protein
MRNVENCIKNSLQYNGSAKYLAEDPKQHSWLVGDSLVRDAGSHCAAIIGEARMAMGQEPRTVTKERWKLEKNRTQMKTTTKFDMSQELECYNKFTGRCKSD